MKSDNTSSHSSSIYDLEILKTIPYYTNIHDETINFIKAYRNEPRNWLDTGCGTGNFAAKVLDQFNLNEIVLADPSEEMLNIAKNKLQKKNITYIHSDSYSLNLTNDYFEVITAIQAHHYLSKDDREKATRKCYNLLQSNGMYVTFENTRPISDESIIITKEYWKQFQIKQGKTVEQAENHLNRFDKEYFPVMVNEHLELYSNIGFRIVDFFWKSYFQVGFYCIK
jgi:tRNA (cmo5U34)-methyltransferase